MKGISKLWLIVGFVFLINISYAQPTVNHNNSSKNVIKYGPVTAGETLSTISARLDFDKSVDRHQIMLALLQANPQAFKNPCNLNSLKVGVTLQVPTLSTVRKIEREVAIQEITRQAAQWHDRKTHPLNCPVTSETKNLPAVANTTGSETSQLPITKVDYSDELVGKQVSVVTNDGYIRLVIAILVTGIITGIIVSFKYFKKYDAIKKLLNNTIFVALLIGGGFLYIYLNNHIFYEFEGKDLFEQKLTLNYPIYAIQDAEGNRYVIDNSMRRISKISKTEEVVYRIHGGSRDEQRFFYANEIEVDDEGYLYILNYVADYKGFYLVREEILRFSPMGNFDRLVYRKVFSEEEKKAQLIQRGEIFSLEIKKKNILSWFRLTDSGITKYNYLIKQHLTKRVHYHSLPEANIVVGDIMQLSVDSFIYSSKDGLITEVFPDGHSNVLFSAEIAKIASGEFIVPWEISVDATGKVYFVDLEGQNIRAIVSPTTTEIVLNREKIESQRKSEIKPYNYYRLSVNLDGTLITCNDEAVVVQAPSGEITYLTSAHLPLLWQIKISLFWGIFLISIMLIIWEIRLIYVNLLKRKVPNVLLLSMGIIVIVGLVAFLSSYYFISNFSGRYQQVVFEKLSQVIQLVPKVLDSSRIESIKEQKDFNNADYKYVYDTLYASLNKNQDYWNEGYYFALYRVINGRLYGFMYTDGRINMYYPFDWLGDGGVYDQALAGKIATEAATDITGDWIYGVGPVTNANGEVIALLEIGTDLYYLRLENERLIKELVLNLVIVLIILILLLVEISYVAEMLKKKYHKVATEYFSEAMLVRPLSFLYFTAISISVTFIPLLMKKFYKPIPGLSQEMVLAMPLSLELFFFGVGTTIAGSFSRYVGWQRTFYVGLVATSTGLLLSALASDMLSFNIARSMTGLSSGFTLIAIRSLINQEQRAIERSQGFSHFYAGMTAGISAGAVLGGTLANHLSFSNIFFVSLVIIALTLVFQLVYLRKPSFQQLDTFQKREPINLLNSLKIFLMSGKNVVFFIMIVFPTYIASTFAGYYFPLFAESQGLSSASTGLFIISGGLLVIYLGPVLSHYLERQWGTYKSMILGSLLWGMSLIIFGFIGDLVGAILTLVLMGITEGFCMTAQNEFFLRLPLVEKLGEDRAVGYFEFLSSIAETAGPMTFALALILGASGFLFLGIGIITLALLFAFLNTP